MRVNFLTGTNPLTLIIAIIIAVAIVASGVVLYIIFSNRRRVNKLVMSITRKYNSVHDLLTSQIANELKRVYSIAQLNIEYEPIYNRNKDLYDEIISQEDAEALNAINIINKLLVDKKFKVLVDEIEVAKNKVLELEEKYNQLSESLGEIISLDDENRQDILKCRREFRNVREEFENRKTELKYIEDSFIKIFDKLESIFSEVEKLLSAARYFEAKERIPDIEQTLKALEKANNVLPKLTTLAYVSLPNNIAEIKNEYNGMIQEGYPLHHLRFNTALESWEKAIESIQQKILNFHFKNIEFELNQIRDAIITMKSNFSEEVEARKFFNENYEKIYNDAYKLENRYIKLKRSIPEYKMTYLLRESSFEEVQSIQQEINELGVIKRTLDTYVHSSSQQPYTALSKRLNDLAEERMNVENNIDTLQDYLNSLRKDADAGYNYITKTFVSLKNKEYQLRSINVPNLTTTFKNDFTKCYELLDECGEVISKLPIDVNALNENISQIKEIYNILENKMSKISDIAKQAEEAIVYANQYRQEFYDVRTTLSRAERSFNEGDFVRTSSETVNMIKKIRPESGK